MTRSFIGGIACRQAAALPLNTRHDTTAAAARTFRPRCFPRQNWSINRQLVARDADMASQGERNSLKEKRLVILAIDSSEHAEYAFDCEFQNLLATSLVWGRWHHITVRRQWRT